MIITTENYEGYLKLQGLYDQIKDLAYSDENIVELASLFHEVNEIAKEIDNKLLINELRQTKWKYIDTLTSPELEAKYLEMKFNEAKVEIKIDLRRYGKCED